MKIDVYLRKSVLIRTYKAFLSHPNKIFVASEFNKRKETFRSHLNVLISLGLIEKVPTVYNFGNKLKSRRDVIGYKLKKIQETKGDKNK